MAISPASIKQNSDTLFGILNQSQTKDNEQKEKLAALNIATKTKASADKIRGSLLDITV